MTGNGIGLALVAEARRLGLSLRADGDTIKVKPADRLPPDLAERIRTNRAEVLAVLRSPPNGDAPGCPQTHANEPDGQTDGVNAPEGKGFDAKLFLAELQAKDTPIPVKWELDDLDRRCLLQLGILPTPSVDDLPEPWRTGYRTHAAKLAKIGVLVEQAEHIAFQETLRRMLAAGELAKEGW